MKIEGNCWKFRFWRLPHIEHLELFYGHDVTVDYPVHMHEDHAVVMILQGMDITHKNGTTRTAYPGNVVLLNAGEVHASQSIGTEYRIMNIHPDLMDTIAMEVFGRRLESPYFPHYVQNDCSLFQSLLNLHLMLEQNLSPLEHQVTLISTLGELLKSQQEGKSVSPSRQKENRAVNATCDYLKSHFAENVTMAQLTAITNFSPFYLIRVFREQTGVPPHEYQTQLRIAHTRKLLRKGMSISEVAMQTGFFDQSHFSRNFKRIVGVTPGQYMERRR